VGEFMLEGRSETRCELSLLHCARQILRRPGRARQPCGPCQETRDHPDHVLLSSPNVKVSGVRTSTPAGQEYAGKSPMFVVIT